MDVLLMNLYFNTLLTLVLDSYTKSTDCVFIFSERNDLEIHPKIPFIRLKIDSNSSIPDMMSKLGEFKCQFWIIQVDDFKQILPKFQKGIRSARQKHGIRRTVFVPTLKKNVGNWSVIRENVIQLFKTPEIQKDPHLVYLIPVRNDPKYCDRQFLTTLIKDNIFEEDHNVEPNTLFCQGNTLKETFLIEFLTHQFVGQSNRSKPITLDFWSPDTGSFLLNNNILPDKVRNFHGREVRLQIFHYSPPSIVSPYSVDGTEVRICSQYAQSINASVMVFNDEKYSWGEIYENGTGNGVWGQIAMENADFGLGAIGYFSGADPYLEFSQYISFSAVMLLTPKARLLTSFLMPVFPFTPTVWLFTALVVLFIMVTFNILNGIDEVNQKSKLKYQKTQTQFLPLLNINNKNINNDKIITIPKRFQTLESIIISFGIVVEQTFPDSVRYGSTNLKHYLIWVLIYSLLLNCSYNSGLAATLTSPRYEKSVRTMQDVVDFKMDWGASHQAWIYIIMYDTSPKQVQLRKQFRVLSLSELERRTRTRDFAFIIERYIFGSYAIGSWINEESVRYLQTSTEDVYTCMVTALMTKHSIHAEKFNMYTLRIHASGLLQYWEGDMTRKYLNIRLAQYVELSRSTKAGDDPPVKLQITHLKGLFVFLIFGLSLSLITFLIELLISKILSKKKLSMNGVESNNSQMLNN